MNLKSHSVDPMGGADFASGGAFPLLLKQLLPATMAVNAAQQIVYRDQSRYSYRTFRERIGRLATSLRGAGVQGGETVAVMDWDSHRYLEAYFAIPMMGAVLMTVNVRLSPEQVAYTLNHSGARTLIVHADFLPLVTQLKPQLKAVDTFVLIADGAAMEVPAGFVGEYERLVEAAAPDFEFPDFDENAPATTFYTTGTTGLPKGVSFSHRQLVLHTLACMATLGGAPSQGHVHRDDVYMPMTPMFHVHAWGMPYVATAMGMKQVYPGRYAPELLLGLIANEKVTVSHGVPTLLHMLLSHPSSKDVNLQGLKMIIGGSALPQGLARMALERGIDVFTGYGMSETAPVLTISQVKTQFASDAERALEVRTRAGMPLPLVDLRIVDELMRELPRDGKAVGEVVARAPWLTGGYVDDLDSSRALWQGGWLHTKDVGAIDDEGYLRITDRMKDVIKTGGEWVSSLEIEDLVSRHPAVAEVAVIGVTDPRWGERPVAFVVARPKQAVDTGAVRAHLEQFVRAGRISRYAVPEQVLVVGEIPKTSVGKPNKRLLREQNAKGLQS
jgi:fatty-acyl-CoA synthase